LEKERDDIAKREADIRKKAREVNAKARKLEDELETERDAKGGLEEEVSSFRDSMAKLHARVSAAETALEEARADLEKERKTLDKRIEEEKTKWKLENLNSNSGPLTPSADSTNQGHFLRAESFGHINNRKTSNPDLLGLHHHHNSGRRSNAGSRAFSPDLVPVHTGPGDSRSSGRRPSAQPFHHPGMPMRTPTDSTTPSRQDSLPYTNGSVPPSATISVAPSIDIDDMDRDRDSNSSPHRTVNELISVSTVGAGPSVQLVERMSAAVRRLESEKASTKEEMSRVLGQRDEARQEVVTLMREVEGFKGDRERVEKLELEVKEVNARYDAALEMLGEKQEEAEELRNDVQDLKKIYRELVESTLK
jgi:TATA element modulatory factor